MNLVRCAYFFYGLSFWTFSNMPVAQGSATSSKSHMSMVDDGQKSVPIRNRSTNRSFSREIKSIFRILHEVGDVDVQIKERYTYTLRDANYIQTYHLTDFQQPRETVGICYKFADKINGSPDRTGSITILFREIDNIIVMPLAQMISEYRRYGKEPDVVRIETVPATLTALIVLKANEHNVANAVTRHSFFIFRDTVSAEKVARSMNQICELVNSEKRKQR